MPKYNILPLTKPDLPTLSQHLQDSKLPLTINRLLFKNWPNYVAQRENYTKSVYYNFGNSAVERWKVVDVESGSGVIVGHLVLTRKKPGGDGYVRPSHIMDSPEIPGYFNAEVFGAVREAVGVVGMEGGVDYLELTHIYITPSHRNQGIGSSLVQLALKTAVEAGVPLSVISEPEARDFFLKLGFRDTGFADIELGRWAPEFTGFGVFRLFGMVGGE